MPGAKRILVVDDEGTSLRMMEAFLRSFGHEVEAASDGIEALTKLRLGFDLVLLDLVMPHMDGFQVARSIRDGDEATDIPIIMVTSSGGREERLQAVQAGANDFIAKPIDKTELRIRAESQLRFKEAQDALKAQRGALERTVQKRTEDLRLALDEASEARRRAYNAQIETIQRLGRAAEYRDEETGLHIKRMSSFSHLIANRLKLPPHRCELLLNASPMHDVGKIGVPDSILMKPGKLDPNEWRIMKTHAEIGAGILGDSSSAILQAGEIIALNHHERWDGSGYPNGLSGEDIPLEGRIVAIADVFDALTSRRPYKPAFSNQEAVEMMREGRGQHFDPRLLDLFLGNFEDVLDIQQRYRDGARNAVLTTARMQDTGQPMPSVAP